MAITGGNRQDILVVDSSVDVDATDEFLEGDYIELDDLCSLASSSSSSDNSSIMLINSEEYLDVDAFNLRDLESESVHDTSEEHIESGFCMSTLSRPNQVLNNPPPTGIMLSLIVLSFLWILLNNVIYLYCVIRI